MTSTKSEVEAWKERGAEALAQARATEARKDEEEAAAEHAARLQDWLERARAEGVYGPDVRRDLATRVSGIALPDRFLPQLHRVWAVCMVLAFTILLSAFLLSFEATAWLYVIGYPVLAIVGLVLSRHYERRALAEHEAVAWAALKPVQEWAAGLPFGTQHLCDFAHIPESSWYRLILCFEPDTQPTDQDELAAMLAGVICELEPVKVTASLDLSLPRATVDISHPQRQYVDPSILREQLTLLVERGLVALHQEHPLICVRFGTLGSSIHR